MKMAIEKAHVSGVGVVTTTYHDHIGSAGKYVRMALRQHLIGITFSGRTRMAKGTKLQDQRSTDIWRHHVLTHSIGKGVQPQNPLDE